jgi:hypothetical protein
MKKLVLSLGIVFLAISGSIAQEMKEDKRQMMEKLKQTYIQEELQLEEEQMKEFNKIYSEFQQEKELLKEEMHEVRKRHHEMKLDEERLKEMSEEEALKVLQSKLEREAKLLEIERKYLDQMVESISAVKVLEYKHAEREFKRELLHMLKDEKHQHHMERELMEKKRHERHEMKKAE